MKIGVDIDNTITYTTETIMHYATVYGQENQLNIIPDLNHYYIEDVLAGIRSMPIISAYLSGRYLS